MSGGFQYNLTTESQFQEMKQRNYQLSQQNQLLKQSLQELITINNELTDSMEEFNASAAKNGANKNNFSQKNQQLNQQLEYYKNLVYTNQDKNQIINALEGLIDSFNQTQKLYEQQITNICEELDHYKSQWQAKLENYEHIYINKLKNTEQLITQLRKKEEIVSIIQKKMNQQEKNPRSHNTMNRVKKKYSQIDRQYDQYDKLETISEKKAEQNTTNNLIKSQQINFFQQELETLRERQKKLTQEINQKNKVISIYLDLITKLRKKLQEKY